MRLDVFVRDYYRCAHCQSPCIGKANTPRAAICNHIVRHKGNEELFYDESNLETVCKSCHDGLIQSMEKGGRMIRSDGW